MALYALFLVVVYELVVDSFSIALGYALTFAVPWLVTVHVFGRLNLLGNSRGAMESSA